MYKFLDTYNSFRQMSENISINVQTIAGHRLTWVSYPQVSNTLLIKNQVSKASYFSIAIEIGLMSKTNQISQNNEAGLNKTMFTNQ